MLKQSSSKHYTGKAAAKENSGHKKHYMEPHGNVLLKKGTLWKHRHHSSCCGMFDQASLKRKWQVCVCVCVYKWNREKGVKF